MILYGKGFLTGCGPYGCSLVSIFFLSGQYNIAVCFLNKTFLLLFQVLFVCLFCCFVYSSLEVENYIEWESIGGVSPRHLNTFSNLFIDTYQYMLYIAAIFDCTYVHYLVHYQIIRT